MANTYDDIFAPKTETTTPALPANNSYDDIFASKTKTPTDAGTTLENLEEGDDPGNRWHKAIRYADDFARLMANGSTFGFADKVAAALHFGDDKSYSEHLEDERSHTQRSTERYGNYAMIPELTGALSTYYLPGSALKLGRNIPVLGRLLGAPVTRSTGILRKGLEGVLEGTVAGGLNAAGRDEDVGTDVGLGAVSGAAAPLVLGGIQRLITPNPVLDEVRKKFISVLDAAGVDTSAGTRVGSKTLRYFEDQTTKLPMGTALSEDPSKNTLKQLTRAAMDKAGIPSNVTAATADKLDQAFTTTGGTIGKLQGAHPVSVDSKLMHDLVDITNNEIPLLANEGQQNVVRNFLKRMMTQSQIDPKEAGLLRSQIGRVIRGQVGPNASYEYRNALAGAQDALDDALERSMHAAGASSDVAKLQTARRQYANLHTLTDALSRSGARGEFGELTPSALAGAVDKAMGKTSAARGRGDLNSLGSAARALLQTPPESGTATRSALWNPLAWAASAPAQTLINSPLAQKYLGNQALSHLPQSLQDAPYFRGVPNAVLTPMSRDVAGGYFGGLR